MNENPYNYGEKILCSMGCKEEQTNAHILSCNRTNKNNEPFKYEDFLNGPFQLKIQIFKKFDQLNNIKEQLRDSV